VVTFYAFLSEKQHGRFVIRLCRTASCDMKAKDAVARQLKTISYRIRETTPDGRFTLGVGQLHRHVRPRDQRYSLTIRCSLTSRLRKSATS